MKAMRAYLGAALLLGLLLQVGDVALAQSARRLRTRTTTTTTTTSTTTPVVIPNSVDLIVSDMLGFHEGPLAGVSPWCSWCQAPRINSRDPAYYIGKSADGQYLTPQFIQWGAVYADANNSTVPSNVGVNIRNMYSYYFSKRDRVWRLLDYQRTMDGRYYATDFSAEYGWGTTKTEADGSKTVLIKNGVIFHFWPTGGRHVDIDISDVGGVFTTFQARLVKYDPAGADNLSKASLLAEDGADYWVNYADSRYSAGNPTSNDDVAMGKFKYLTKDWKSFNMHNMTEADLRAYPPPIN